MEHQEQPRWRITRGGQLLWTRGIAADLQQPRWRIIRRRVLWTLGIGAILTVAVLIGYRYDKTLWGWLKLLVVPAVIAGGGIWFLPGEWRCSGVSRSP